MVLSSNKGLAAALGLGFSLMSGVALAEAPSNAELQRQIEELKQQIRVLTERLSGQPAAQPELSKKVQTQEQQIQAQQQQIEALAKQAEDSQKNSFLARTKVGGYGELHYNNLKDDKNGDELEQIDLHRFVLFFGHRFDDRTRLFSELEVEHGFVKNSSGADSSPGEVEMEQAYIEHDLSSQDHLRAGLMLVPMGILNETHEPPTFYGVERNPVENRIIPTTYRVGGVGLNGQIGESGFGYDVMLHEGLKVKTDLTAKDAYGVRGGRQSGANSDAEDLAATGRIKYTGVPGLTLAAAVQYNRDVTQGLAPAGDKSDQDAILAAINAEWQSGPFTARALYARFDVDSDSAKSIKRDLQQGYYVEAGYRFLPDVGTFVRYNVFDDIARAGVGDDDFEVKQTDVGVNYWLTENVVFKADYQMQSGANDDDGVNLGVGYQF